MNVEDGPSLGTDSSAAINARRAPMSRPIRCKSFRVVGPQLDLRMSQLTLATHDLKNRLRLGLTKHYDSVNFACLDGIVG